METELARLADDGCPNDPECDRPHVRYESLRTRFAPAEDAALALRYWDGIRPGMTPEQLSLAVCLLASRAEPLARHVRDLLADLETQKRLNVALAVRVAAQSELLSKRAGAAPRCRILREYDGEIE